MLSHDAQQILERIRSGAGLRDAAPRDELDRAADEALRCGLATHYEHALLPEGIAQFLVVERTDFGYEKGVRQATSSVAGSLVEVFGGGPLRGERSTASHFCEHAALLPTNSNVVTIESRSQTGVLECVLHLKEPLGRLLRPDDLEELDVLLYCDSEDAEIIATFRGLACADWQVIDGPMFHPRIGVGGHIPESLALADRASRLLRRVQPPFRDRFLRLPAAALARSQTGDTRLRIRLGPGAELLAATLKNRVRLNCLPVWNGRIAETESLPQAADGIAIVNTQGFAVRNLLVLECYDREIGTSWHDARFSTADDPFLFDVAVADGHRPRLRFHQPAPWIGSGSGIWRGSTPWSDRPATCFMTQTTGPSSREPRRSAPTRPTRFSLTTFPGASPRLTRTCSR